MDDESLLKYLRLYFNHSDFKNETQKNAILAILKSKYLHRMHFAIELHNLLMCTCFIYGNFEWHVLCLKETVMFLCHFRVVMAGQCATNCPL